MYWSIYIENLTNTAVKDHHTYPESLGSALPLHSKEMIADQFKRQCPAGNILHELKDQLIPNYSTQPQICVLHRVHKEGHHSAVLCPAVGPPKYRLAKELVHILTPFYL